MIRPARWPGAPASSLRRGRKPPLIYHQKKEQKGDSKSEIFSQIFFHALDAAFHGAADSALVHALLLGNLAISLAEDQVSVHPAALDFLQGVESVPEPKKQLFPIQDLLGAGLVNTGGVFDPIITVQRVISLVVVFMSEVNSP